MDEQSMRDRLVQLLGDIDGDEASEGARKGWEILDRMIAANNAAHAILSAPGCTDRAASESMRIMHDNDLRLLRAYRQLSVIPALPDHVRARFARFAANISLALDDPDWGFVSMHGAAS